jgi:hypothetical protein
MLFLKRLAVHDPVNVGVPDEVKFVVTIVDVVLLYLPCDKRWINGDMARGLREGYGITTILERDS